VGSEDDVLGIELAVGGVLGKFGRGGDQREPLGDAPGTEESGSED
jgi:hypothetical protein